MIRVFDYEINVYLYDKYNYLNHIVKDCTNEQRYN